MLISEWSSDVCSSDLLTLLLADRLQLLTQLASEDELAAHQRGDVQAARLDHVVHGLAQPAQQLVLMDVRLADLAVEPQHQGLRRPAFHRSEEHTSELQSLMRITYAVFCLKKKTTRK